MEVKGTVLGRISSSTFKTRGLQRAPHAEPSFFYRVCKGTPFKPCLVLSRRTSAAVGVKYMCTSSANQVCAYARMLMFFVFISISETTRRTGRRMQNTKHTRRRSLLSRMSCLTNQGRKKLRWKC